MKKYFLFILISCSFASCQPSREQTALKRLIEPVNSLYDPKLQPFYHGVASGDPTEQSVIIWTRVTPIDSLTSIDVKWEISTSEDFSTVKQNGTGQTSPDKDYTIKIDVTGLNPNTYYYYRFTALGNTSITGRTKTLPSGNVDSLKFAVVSCSNWQHGYFNAYARIAEKQLDAVLHLGDYIYEYGVAGARNVGRTHLPTHEILTLSDYRTRYSQYHLDSGLRAMRQHHPLIAIWDDHEVANNSYVEGAENHQPEEGDYDTRKAAARKAYYEWLPIREKETHYRNFSFGSLGEVIMLDERLEARTRQAEGQADPTYRIEERAMLGPEQFEWLTTRLKDPTPQWKVIGNQVMYSDLDRSEVNPNNPRNMDSWDGYPAEKERLAEFIKSRKLNNIIFLTGDTHASWAFEVVAMPQQNKIPKNYRPIAIEFGTTSISSSNSNESTADDTVMMREALYMKANPHLKFVNQRDHGYLILTLSPKQARADWYFVETVLRPDPDETLAKTFIVDANNNSLRHD